MEEPTDPLEDKKPSGFSAFFANTASGLSEVFARTAGAAGVLLSDGDLRRRGAQVLASNASKGLRSIQRGIQSVGQGPRQIQSVLQRISQQIEERRLQALLEQQRDTPVDVQIGFQLYEDAPQELRSRLWMALLRHPELAVRYKILQVQQQEPVDGGNDDGNGGVSKVTECDNEVADTLEVVNRNLTQVETGSLETRSKDTSQNTNSEVLSSPEIVGNQQATERYATHEEAEPKVEEDEDEKKEEKGVQNESDGVLGIDNAEKSIITTDWEMVADRGAQRWRQGAPLLAGGSLHRSKLWTPEQEEYRQELMSAMALVPWPMPSDFPTDSRYATLLEISIGQEEVDEVISRDVHRTFPEHAQFGNESGQQALFRVLKAYSLHDLETGYCQGLGFVGGLLLFYLPEEAAFHVLCRLLAESGPNLRRFYLPGLQGLKLALRTFDILMEEYLSNLKSHLDTHGAASVLFASQWFLTAFSCPFPVSFACRLIDVMLVEDSDAVLMRVALAIMAESEPELLMQDDFEELLTYLKVEPVQWDAQRLRRVLNAAIHDSPITKKVLDRVTKVAIEKENVALPLVNAVAADGIQSNSEMSQSKDEHETNEYSSNVDEAGPLVVQDGEEEDVDDVARELAAHQADLDTAYVQMVLDLDNLWGKDDVESGGE